VSETDLEWEIRTQVARYPGHALREFLGRIVRRCVRCGKWRYWGDMDFNDWVDGFVCDPRCGDDQVPNLSI
jgi:hypothetical protein